LSGTSHVCGLSSVSLLRLGLLLLVVPVFFPINIVADFCFVYLSRSMLREVDLYEVIGLSQNILVLKERVEELLESILSIVEELSALCVPFLGWEGWHAIEGLQIELLLDLGLEGAHA
jgi:hypothetical protein